MTWGDRIRNMTDEELAYLLADTSDCNGHCRAATSWCIDSDSACHSGWLEWLKQEAADET